MTQVAIRQPYELGPLLTSRVLAPMKQAFVGKDEIIDLLGVCLIARENLFLLGPPGTAKSALVQDLAKRIEGRVFDYLLTRFTEPNEIFGPFDIRKLREGDLVTNTEGMLPEATFVFLDELLNANSAILNSLLMVLNERVFRRGRETRSLPTLMVVGASNHLPEDDALGALFDRFLLRVRCDNVEDDQLSKLLSAGWKLDTAAENTTPAISLDEVNRLQALVREVDFTEVQPAYVELVHHLRRAGIAVSDRRAVKLQRLLAASAVTCGRLSVNRTDLWVLRYIWDTEEQQEVLAALVTDAVNQADEEENVGSHPRSRANIPPDPELLAHDLDLLAEQLGHDDISEIERAQIRDRVALLAARCQWVAEEQPRRFLDEKLDALWQQLRDSDE